MGGKRVNPERPAKPWIWLAAPGLVLMVEAMVLTPYVEFTRGPMAAVANPMVFTSGLVALAAFAIMVSRQGTAVLAQSARPRGASMRGWGLLHGALFATFFAWSVRLNQQQATAGDSTGPMIWLLLAFAVATSALLITIPARQWVELLRRFAPQAAAAALIGVGMWLLMQPARNLWPVVAKPAVEIARGLMLMFHGHEAVTYNAHHWPIIGTSPVTSILVTPPCSEMDSLLAFVLVAGTYWVARWPELRPVRFAVLVAAGGLVIYILNGMRLYFLVLLALAIGPDVTVRFAHSRISGIAFLLLSLAMLHFGSRFARRADEPRSWRKQKPKATATTPAAGAEAGAAQSTMAEPVAAG